MYQIITSILLISTDKEPHSSKSASAESNGEKDFSVTNHSDMAVSDIAVSDNGACWTILFEDKIQKPKIITRQLFARRKLLDFGFQKSVHSNGICNTDHREGVVRGFEPCFAINSMWTPKAAFDCENLVTLSFAGFGKEDCDDGSSVSHSDEDIEIDFDFEDYSCTESESEEEFNDSDDTDDLQIVFDDAIDSAHFQKETDPSFHIQRPGLFHASIGFNGLQDYGMDEVLPCVTSVQLSDILNGSNQLFAESEMKMDTSQVIQNLQRKENLKERKQKGCKKIVSFAEQEKLATVHPMVKWAFAYRKARKGPWERFACDRSHFQRRIQSCEKVLGPMLKKKYILYLSENL